MTEALGNMNFNTIRTSTGRVAKSVFIVATMLIAISTNSYCQEAPGQNSDQTGPSTDQEYAKDASTEINVKNADIAAVVRIFSKKTKRNYILDENVKGKVTIYLPGKVSSEEAIRILDSVLALKGFTSVPIGENLWKIVPSKDAKSSTIPTVTDSSEHSPSAAVVTRLLSLKYVSAEDIQQLIQPLISPEGLINAYTGTNSLIIIDSEDNIERLAGIVNSLDVPSSDRDMTIIPVKHADASDVAQKLSDLLGAGENDKGSTGAGSLDILGRNVSNINSVSSPGIPRPAGLPATGSGAASTKTVAARGREPKILPDERTNSIIVVADEDTTTRVRALVSQLDSEIDLSGNRFYVYRCQHASAEELASVMAGLVGGGSGGGSGSAGGFTRTSANDGLGGDEGSSFGNSRNSRSRNSNSSSHNNRSGSSRSGSGLGGGGSRQSGGGNSGPTSVSLGDNISITADPSTNSLIINAGKADYDKIKELLKQLDIKRRQVLVEAMLLEVGVDDTQQLSTEFSTSAGGADGGVLAKSDFGNLSSLLADPTKLSNFSVAAASSGTLSLPNGIKIPTQTVLLNAAKSNNNANVLSAPNILTTDNEEAEIVVGQTVPFVASQATSDTNLNNTFNQIDREDVGITLRLTPQISSGDFVTLNIYTEVSNVIASTLGSALGPTTTKRQSQTTVIAKDGQMIVTGGLMSDDVTESETGVPFLKDVPVLGHLFRSSSEAHRRTNLLIFLTPRIVKDQFDARDNTLVKREHMENVIASENVTPNRYEVLENAEINHVAEGGIYDGPKPGTIIPPEKPQNTAPLKTAKNLDENGKSVIELSASPALPGEKVTQERPVDSSLKTAPRAMPKPEAIETSRDKVSKELTTDELRSQSNLAAVVVEAKPRIDLSGARAALNPKVIETSSDEMRVVVFKITKGKAVGSLPFSVGEKSRAFGIVVPPGTNALARGFFQAGEIYRYQVEGGEILCQPLAIFASLEEAKAYYPDLDNKWYTLSPYEIMNIGKSPWAKSTGKKADR